MFCNSLKVIFQQESNQLLECIVSAHNWSAIDQSVQEQIGQTLDRYGRMKARANKPIVNHKYK